jgi:hypothetical protein
MDSDIIILISLLATALSWWLAILIKEEVQLIRQYKSDEIDRLERAERVKHLTNKL